jgi:oligopeptide transport system substrate-binding protein
MRRVRLLLTVVGPLASVLWLGSCSKPETAVSVGNREKILHRAIDADPVDADPHIVTGIAEMKLLYALFEPLVMIDPDTLRPRPALAERWEVSPDALVYTFHLRPAAKWSNGDPVVAQDCVDAWRRFLTPSLAADYANQLYCIKNAEAFRKGTADFSTVGIVALDAHTLRVTLERPTPYFLGLIAQPNWAPINLRAIAAHGDPYQRGSKWTRPGNLVGNGPFVLKQWTPGQRVTVDASPTYWDHANVHLRTIHFYPIDKPETQEQAFRAGQLHVTEILPLSKVAAYQHDTRKVLRTDPYLDTYFFRFNVNRPPLDDPRVRRALSLAIDRQGLAQKVLLAGQTAAPTLIPPGMPDYTPPTRPVTDLATARQLLVEAGYPGGKGLPPIEIVIPTKGFGPITGETVQEGWHRDLGLDVRLLQQEQKVIYAERRARNYQILLSDWLGDYFDPTTFLDLWKSDSDNNHTGWKNADYDKLLEQAARTIDPAARATILQHAEALMLDAAPIAPIYHNTHVYLVQPAVKGWRPTPLDQLDLKNVSLEP